MLAVATESRLASEGGDEVEGVEDEEGGELFTRCKSSAFHHISTQSSRRQRTSRTFNRAVGLSLRAF